MTHVHKPEHGSCGACPGAKGCPMVYCPTCPTPVLCEQAEALQDAFAPAVQTEKDLTAARDRARVEEAQRPSLGRVVHVLVHPLLNNGSDVAPAVVTRVWGKTHDGTGWRVNLRVWLDGTNHAHEWATSRTLHATEADARREHDELLVRLGGLDEEHRVCVSGHAFWPARA